MGRKRYKQRAAVGWLGKDLTRRSKGRCELCGSKDQIRPFELPPFPDEPTLERTLSTCARCREWLESERIDPVQARFLETAVWHDEPAVRLAAARLLVIADFVDAPWIRDALDAVQFDPATSELIDADGASAP